MTKNQKKLSEQILAENSWWTYKRDEFAYENGTKGEYYYGENNDSVMVVPVFDDGKIILIQQYRYLRDKLSLELVCGGIEKSDETAQAAAERELLEETGYQAEEFVKVGMFDALNGLFKDTTHIFIARGLNKINEPQNDLGESIELLIRRPDEIDEFIRRGEIWDGQTLATWAIAHHDFMHKLNQ